MSTKPVTKWGSNNVGFACSHAMKGYGFGVAIACGKDTDVGTMTALSFRERPPSRMERHQTQIGYYTLVITAIVFILLLWTTGLERGKMLYEVNLSLLIALTPFYLPFIVYWGMRRTKKQMNKKQCYARNLRSTTTVGLSTVIVSDLVGTMSKRRMRVSEIFVDMELLSAENLDLNAQSARFIELVRASVLCNDAVICPGNIGVPKMQKDMYGNILDIALLKFGLLVLPNIDQLRRDHEKVANKYYTSADKMQVTVHRTRGEDGQPKLILLMKGHCSVVVRRCSTFGLRGEELPLDSQLQDIVLNLADGLLEAGRHVRAFAYKELSNELELRRFSQVSTSTGLEDGEHKYRDYLAVDTFALRFLGIIATHNPARSTIPRAVVRCRSAGIKLILVTRRKRRLAKALAVDVGILAAPWEAFQARGSLVNTDIVDMSKLADQKPHHQRWQIEQLLLDRRDLVCADTSSDQLHWIVDACRRLGAVVSVIGSSLHDTPAIRSGHVGVAKFGYAVMCEASADLILLDSSFATLVSVVADSRLLFENLKKALAYCLATNTTSILVYTAFFLLRVPFHIHIMPELILAFFVNLLPAMTLIYEPPEEKLMQQMPKIYDDFLLNSRLLLVSHILVGTIEAAAVFITYFVYMADKGFVPRTLVGHHIMWHDKEATVITDAFGQEWCSSAKTGVPGVRPLPDEPDHDAVHQPGVDQDGTCQPAHPWLRQLAANCGSRLFDLPLRGDLPFGRHCLPATGGDQRTEVGFFRQHDIRQLDILTLVPHCFSFGRFLWTICPFVALLVFLESTRKYFLRLFPDSWLELATMY
ncbi:sodium/potassium-transporting ATPase subunit alpha isoform X2 [Drosophila elegans]|uniref:sodium/potassium-transporting ATPase subunit alpha isoform X2 n=1 Tax=Drosophila elegans TaxID=30023 RepID=UPI001BC83976|nr:sodium/potassium-transporting ATPase subunit alpha isoform X2 [Drosophila elegans]